MRQSHILGFIAVALAVGTRAAAQVHLGTVAVEAERSDEPADDSTSFVTIIDARSPSVRAASVADLLERQAGVRILSRGGLGAFTSVSIRGSEQNEVAIFVDGVPLSRAASGTIDLGQIPADGLERVEVYRGVPPVELGAEAIGGAINLVTRKATRHASWRAAGGAGSFGARSVSGGYDVRRDGLRIDLSAAYRGASGDFSFYDNGGTLINPSDDVRTIRRNNGFDQVALDATISGGRKLRWRLGTHGFLKRQGVPGLGTTGTETVHARLTTGRLVLDGQLAGSSRRLDWRVDANLLVERSSFANPLGEAVGPFGPSVSEGEALAGGLGARVDLPAGAHQLWSAIGEARFEHRAPYDLLTPSQSGSPASRVLGGVALVDELRLLGERLALTPALRIDGAASSLAASAAPATALASDFFVSPRIGVRARLGEFVTLRASAGRFVRFPTLIEQFGDGAFILARPALRPETAWGGDAGAAVALQRHRLRASLEADLFGRQVTDAITFVAGGNAVSAINIGEARFLGAESRLSVEVGRWLAVKLDYTYLDAIDLTDIPGERGNRLPGRAAHQLGGRVDLIGDPARIFYEIEYVDSVYRDPQNYNRLPPHTLQAVGAAFHRTWLTVAIEVRNLADVRVIELPLGGSANRGKTTPYPLVDVYNYPLPGRAVYATVSIQN